LRVACHIYNKPTCAAGRQRFPAKILVDLTIAPKNKAFLYGVLLAKVTLEIHGWFERRRRQP